MATRSRKYKQGLYKDPKWFKLRASQLKREPFCRYCADQGIKTRATVVDHIIPHEGRAEYFFTRNNLQSLCKACHDQVKQKEERKGGPIGANIDGSPRDPDHPWNK